jgi:hypothetical protein
MPHWTTPKPPADDPTSDAAKALTALTAEVDKLFGHAAKVSSKELDALAGHVKTFYTEFQTHLTDAKSKLAAK